MAILSGDIKRVESAIMEDVPDATHTPTLADTRTFTVRFAPGGSLITATPVARPELPPSHHPYVATVRLIEV